MYTFDAVSQTRVAHASHVVGVCSSARGRAEGGGGSATARAVPEAAAEMKTLTTNVPRPKNRTYI
jgi:hypothetical protein